MEYQLNNELDDFFNKVDNGDYSIIGFHMPFIFYQKMIHLLNQKKYEDYFTLYETCDLSLLKDNYRLVLKINYYMFKHDLENLANSYYELFQYTQNHNELIIAVQTKLQINQYHNATFYLEQVNPMELDKPEYYYMFKAIILEDKKQVEEAFEQLTFVLESIDIDLESPYWFKAIQHSDDESGSALIAKLEEAVGGKRDLTFINQLFAKGMIGVSSYNKMVGTGIEEILCFPHYPFTRVPISRANVLETKSKIELIGKKIIVDATTLTILSATSALNLLEVFDEILVSYSTMIALTERKTGFFKENVINVLEYIECSPIIKKFAVDESMKIKGKATEIIPEDILDCISMAEKLNDPFLNTEVAVTLEFKQKEIIDINAILFYLKEKHPEKREVVAVVIAKMRAMGLDFISFDDEDMYNVYQKQGIESIKPFLKMGINADCKTFPPVYVNFLKRLYKNSVEEFEKCAVKIIIFMDKYVGKTRYYMSSIIDKYPNVESSFLRLIQKPSVKGILFNMASHNIMLGNIGDYLEIIDTPEFKKMISIASAFIGFVIQFVSLFSDDEENRNKYIEFLKQNLSINDDDDINYILQFMNRLKLDKKDNH